MRGRRLNDTPIGEAPRGPKGGKQRQTPGAYWKVLRRDGTDQPLNMHNPKDRRWWSGSPEQYAQNLTGTVWGVITPIGGFGMLSIHTVREHEDGTISVRPGDGSSNSVLISGPEGTWHGYIEHGEWRSV